MAYLPDRLMQPRERERPRHAERPWLNTLRSHISGVTDDKAAEYWPPFREDLPPYYNYRLEHIKLVECDALHIHTIERGDLDVLLAAVWAHDRFQPQFNGEQHSDRGAQWARDYLKFIRFPDSKIQDVCMAIKWHGHVEMDIPDKYHEARILWDADRLARLGAADMLNFMLCHTSVDFLGGLEHSNRFTTGSVTIRDFAPLLLERKPQAYRADFFYFDESRRIARERIAATRSFLESLESQLSITRL